MAKFNDMQEILDFVVPKIIAQGVKSLNNRRCAYNGPNGTHCAIGWCSDFGDFLGTYDSLVMGFPEKVKETFGPSVLIDFLRNLQTSHDYTDWDLPFVESFRENIKWLTTEWKLIYRETWG